MPLTALQQEGIVQPVKQTFTGDIYDRYLALLERAITGSIYAEKYVRLQYLRGTIREFLFRPLAALLRRKDYHVFKRLRPTQSDREHGQYWPQGQSMIGLRRLRNVRACLETVLQEGIAGDVVETGVWGGGCCIYMKAILSCHRSDKTLWVADSFQGVPKPNPAGKYRTRGVEERPEAFYKFDQLAGSRHEVENNFRSYGLLDERVRFLEGWFCDTLPAAPIERIALMRLDWDLYESTWDALVNLYPKLSPGGYCLIDDYGGIPSCRQAVENYRRQHGIAEPIVGVDKSGVFWRKSSPVRSELPKLAQAQIGTNGAISQIGSKVAGEQLSIRVRFP